MPDRRELPKVDSLMGRPELAEFPRRVRLRAARLALEKVRGLAQLPEDLEAVVVLESRNEASRLMADSLRPIINASGVILHTGAGRARLAPEAAEQVGKIAFEHSNVEIDLDSGKRGDRQTHVRELLQDLTGAEDAFVANNCAAAVFLVLHALASRKEVILSRGQMVEIGGSFRLPDIVRQSGCKLVEVGTTNKTRIEDYEGAITERTRILLRCHPSNFKIVGFVEQPSLRDLAGLAKRHDLVVVDDVGSGCLVDTSRFGLPQEPTLQDSVREGAHLVLASGDKMLGGPQAGLILGGGGLVAKVRKHPLARVVRIDKLTLAALESTLRLYAIGLEDHIPTLQYLARSVEEVKEMALQLQQAYRGESAIADGITEVGGGSLPGVGIPTARLGLRSKNPVALARSLRTSKPPVLARIEDGQVWIDPRTLNTADLEELQRILGELP